MIVLDSAKPGDTKLRDTLRSEAMKMGINLVVCPLVHERDLADALNRGRIAGSGIDVLSVEPPPPDNPLLTARNCFITPHIAWAARAARSRLMDTLAGNIRAFLGGRPVNVVNGV